MFCELIKNFSFSTSPSSPRILLIGYWLKCRCSSVKHQSAVHLIARVIEFLLSCVERRSISPSFSHESHAYVHDALHECVDVCLEAYTWHINLVKEAVEEGNFFHSYRKWMWKMMASMERRGMCFSPSNFCRLQSTPFNSYDQICHSVKQTPNNFQNADDFSTHAQTVINNAPAEVSFAFCRTILHPIIQSLLEIDHFDLSHMLLEVARCILPQSPEIVQSIVKKQFARNRFTKRTID